MSSTIKNLTTFFVFLCLTGCFGETGNGGITGTGYPVQGAAQKGPFLIGSTVDVSRIDSAGSPIEGSLTTETTDSLGSFSFSMNQSGAVHIKVDGYHFNELTGQLSDERLTLNAIAAVEEASDSESQIINVNMLTHLISPRVRTLMAEGKAVQQATDQAQQEWFDAFESLATIESVFKFSVLNLYQEADTPSFGNNYLLFITSVFYQYSIEGSDSTLTSILNSTADDFGDNGIIDSETLLGELTFYATQLSSELIQQNLEDLSLQVKGVSQTAADISSFLTQMIITFPADNSDISNETIINVAGIKKGLGIQYSLMVDGAEVQTLAEEEGSFNWQPYFWSADTDSRHTLLVKASLNDTDSYSNLINVTVKSNLNQQLGLDAPTDNAVIRSQKTVLLEWQPLPGARQYEVEIYDEEELISTQTTDLPSVETSLLNKGLYRWRVRAINDRNNKGSWSDTKGFSINGPEALDTLGLNGQMQYISDNENNLSLLWPALSQATGYRIEVALDENFHNTLQNITTDKNQLALNLNEGEYFWRVSVIDALGLEGDHSDPEYIAITGPETPTSLEASVGNSIDGMYNVDFSWATTGNAEKYQIEIATDEGFTEVVTAEYSIGPEISLELSANNYYWRVTSEDIHDLQSEPSHTLPLEVGVFQRHFGGSGDDRAKYVTTTADGGYVVLASTTSQGDPLGDDWIFKLDSQGGITWEYFYKQPGRNSLKELVVLPDGSITGFGRSGNWPAFTGLIISLDSAGKLLWEKTYSNDEYDSLEISGAVEIDGSLYMLTQGHTCTTEASYTTCVSQNPTIEIIDPENGTIISSAQIKTLNGALLNGATWDSVSSFRSTKTGSFLLGFTVRSADCTDMLVICGRAGIATVDTQGTIEWEWNNLALGTLIFGSYATELPYGGFVLTGLPWEGTGFALFDNRKVHLGTYNYANTSSYQKDYVAFSPKGMMLRLVNSDATNWPVLLSTDITGSTEELMTLTSLKKDSTSPVGLHETDDGGIIMVFTENQNGNNNRDIVVIKTGDVDSINN